jgi:hypothetical protein
MKRLLLICIFIRLIKYAVPSAGDHDPEYHSCLEERHQNNPAEMQKKRQLACALIISKSRNSLGLPMLQYNGHWAYEPILNIEEPAACFASLGNIFPHIYALTKLEIQRDSYMCFYLRVYPIVQIMAWSASVAYHLNKSVLATRCDYAAAYILITLSTWMAFRKCVHTYVSFGMITIILFITVAMSAGYVYLMLSGYVIHGNHMKVNNHHHSSYLIRYM